MTRAVVAVIVALALFQPAPAGAWHKRTPAALQITPADAGAIANPRWFGLRYVAFDSDADILQNQSQGRQVFVFDLQERDKTGLPSIHQLTTGPGDSQRPSSGSHGKRIVFDALDPGLGTRQLYLTDLAGSAPRPLTRGSGGDSLDARMDDAERVVVFESNADLLGNGVAGTQLYLIDLKAMDPECPFPCPATGNEGLTQITLRPGTSRNASPSKRGKKVVFESDADLLETGETETQVYLADAVSHSIVALSHGPGASRNPTLSRNGKQIAFESDADLLGAGVGGTQIFLITRPGTPLQQLTFTPGGVSERPSFSSKGKALAFLSNADLARTGSVGPEVYSYDVQHVILRQITNAPDATADPAYSSGVFAVFLADGDLLENGSTGMQLYLVNLFALQGALPPGL
jgi:Tol biopolymer transport system component